MNGVIVNRLKQKVLMDNPLDKLINEFKEICENEYKKDHLFLFETGVFNFTGEDLFYFSLVIKDKDNDDEDSSQIHLDINYLPNQELKQFSNISIWSNSINELLKTIKESDVYKYITSNNLKPYNIEVFENETELNDIL